MSRLLTLEEAAELLHTSPNTVRFWRNQGTGPKSGKLGRRIFYRETDVLAWIDAQFADDKRPA